MSVHQKITVTRHRQSHAAGGDGGRNTRRYAITHGSHGGRKLGFKTLDQPVVHEKAVHPAGKVACTIRQNRIRRQMLLQQTHDGRHIDTARQVSRCSGLQVGKVILVGRERPGLPWHDHGCGQHFE